ncbi:MAG TPA: SCO family protein, partial [Thermoanaerobaculia bacterium]|nr:SCO family protein [Thermoanaerobaculia bacterium]
MKRALALLAIVLFAPAAHAQSLFPRDVRDGVSIEQRIGAQIPLDLQFVDEAGRNVTLRNYFGDKPVILTPVYYSCPMLCNLVLDGLVKTASNLRFDIGTEFEVVSVSFDPRETAEMAASKKEIYTRRYGREGVTGGWHFLTGDALPIRQLMDSVGFRYAWDSNLNQYAHAATIIVLTPEGKVARYFYGFEYDSRDLRLGLVEASDSEIGSVVDQALLLCYSYDPASGK